MNHFDAVDFSECHSEEVISLFWRSVYMIINQDGSVNIQYTFAWGDNKSWHFKPIATSVLQPLRLIVNQLSNA